MSQFARFMQAGLLALLTVAGQAAADIVHLRSGGKVEGVIVSRTDAEVVVQTNSGGKVKLKASDVVRVETKATPAQVYREMAAKVAADDADGHFALGLWCTDQKLYREGREEFDKTVAIDPNHKGAREKLGYVLKDGKWMTAAEAKKADGFVRHEGKWVTEEERDTAETRQAVADWSRRFRQLLARRPTSQEAIVQRVHDAIGQGPRDVANIALRVVLQDAIKDAIEARYDRTVDARLALLQLIAEQPCPAAAELLQKTAVRDIDARVRAAALKVLVAQKDVDNTAFFVGLLYSYTSSRVRLQSDAKQRATARRVLRRAAEALDALADPRAVPALANTMIVRFRIQESDEELPPASFGFTSNSIVDSAIVTDGLGNRYLLPVTESSNWGLDQTEREVEDPFFFNIAAYNALRKLTGKDLGHDKRSWLAWWYRNRHDVED